MTEYTIVTRGGTINTVAAAAVWGFPQYLCIELDGAPAYDEDGLEFLGWFTLPNGDTVAPLLGADGEYRIAVDTDDPDVVERVLAGTADDLRGVHIELLDGAGNVARTILKPPNGLRHDLIMTGPVAGDAEQVKLALDAALVAAVDAEVTYPHGGAVLASAGGRLSVTAVHDGTIIVSIEPRYEQDDATHYAFADLVFDTVAATLPGVEIELLAEDDTQVRIAPAYR